MEELIDEFKNENGVSHFIGRNVKDNYGYCDIDLYCRDEMIEFVAEEDDEVSIGYGDITYGSFTAGISYEGLKELIFQ